MVVLLAVALGLATGALLPSALAALPDRVPEPADRPRTPYRVLAATPRLRLLFALATAATWAVLAAALGWNADLPAYLLVGAIGVALGYVDLREHRLPDPLTGAAFGGGALLLAIAAPTEGWSGYGRAWLVAAAMFAAFLGLALIRPADLGVGDVKLAAVLGLLLGWLGWGEAVVGAVLAFVFGGLGGVVLLLTGRADRRTPIPFGPFMLVGALVAVVAGGPLVAAYLGR